MKKSKINVSVELLDAIAESSIEEREKISYFRYVGYLTPQEQKELYLVLR